MQVRHEDKEATKPRGGNMKYQLVLVHSFPTNSILLSGLTEFLSSYFDVRFIDLPGFAPHSPPVADVSLGNFAHYVERWLEREVRGAYILGGISFGFLVINEAKVDSRCRAVFAMEPFLGQHSMRMSGWKRLLMRVLVGSVSSTGAEYLVWNSRPFRALVARDGLVDRYRQLFRQIDARTFFQTASLILRSDCPAHFHGCPHILFTNPNDGTIDQEFTVRTMSAAISRLLVVETSVDHYPRELTSEYFESRVSGERVAEVVRFLDSVW